MKSPKAGGWRVGAVESKRGQDRDRLWFDKVCDKGGRGAEGRGVRRSAETPLRPDKANGREGLPRLSIFVTSEMPHAKDAKDAKGKKLLLRRQRLGLVD